MMEETITDTVKKTPFENNTSGFSGFPAAETKWLKDCIQFRITNPDDVTGLPAVIPCSGNSAYEKFLLENKLNNQERLLLILALAPHLSPTLLNTLYEDKTTRVAFKLAGSSNGISVIPTAETALYILAGENLELRLSLRRLFETEHLFYKQSIIELGDTSPGENPLNGFLGISPSWHDQLIFGKFKQPRYSNEFAAHLINSKLQWDELILMPHTKAKLEEVKAYLDHYDWLNADEKLGKQVPQGCRILFHGDSGTGKTAAAALMGKHLGRDVYRVDISTITSKYVGESVKRLNALFNTAENKGWIIFLDEGDALLGQRRQNNGGESNTHYANQDVAFLLQRLENYNGIVIVATNMRTNIDAAFARRFQVSVRFENLSEELLLKLWQQTVSENCPLAPDVNLIQLMKRYPLSPASVINVIVRATVLSLQSGEKSIKGLLLETCIKDEELKYKGQQPFNR